MDGKDYLDQIASTVRPKKKTGFSGLAASPFFKVIVVGIIAFVIVVIVGMLIGGGKTSLKNQMIELKLQLDGTMSVISDYQANLKSSDLRSSSASLYGVLSNTSRDLQEFLQTKYGYKSGDEDEDLKEEANLAKDALETDLFNAKINGVLDRIYAHKMAYQITVITAKESSIHNASSDETLNSIIETSYNGLSNLYGKFNDFSEAK